MFIQPAAGPTDTGDAANRHHLHLSDLTALTEAGLAIVRAQLDVDGLCKLVYEHVARIVAVHSFHLGLFEADRFVLKVWIQDGISRPPAEFLGGQDTGIVGWMRTSQQPLLVRDFEREMDQLPAQPSYAADHPPRSAVFVPLVAGNSVVGSMSIQHPEPNMYSEDDLHVLGIVANQAASAILNARLLETVQRRAEQLSAIAEVGYAITALLDLDDLLSTVVELIRTHFGYYHVQVFLVEDEAHRAVFRASSGFQLNRLWREQGRSQHFGEGIIGWVAAMGQPVLANDISQEPRYIADDPRLLPDTRSELAVPIIFEGNVLGVLDVQSQELENFDGEDLVVLTALANQVAVAVDGAWSYRAQQEEAWITTVLLQVAAVANWAEGLDDVLGAITRLVPMLTGVESCAVWLQDSELGVYELAAASGLTISWEQARHKLRLDPKTAQWPALNLVHSSKYPMEFSQSDDNLLPPVLWEIMAGDRVTFLPLLVASRRIGSLVVSFQAAEVPIRLKDKRLAMLTGIANQAAAAIENVRLSTAHEEEAWISWALLEVSQAISNARSVDEMLGHVVRLAPLLAGVDRCAALLRDETPDGFAVVQQYLGPGDHPSSYEGMRLQPGDLPLLDLAVASQRLQRVDDATHSDLVPDRWRDYVGSRTLIVLPLTAQNEVLGALLVDDVVSTGMISQRREDILNGIARQAGMALENFQLQRLERERIRLGQELQVAQRIQASFLPESTPQVPGYQVAHAWQSAREVGGDFYDFVDLNQGGLGLLVGDVADKGVPAALFMATSLTLLRMAASGLSEPAPMLSRANQLIGANNSSDMFVTVWYGILDPRSHQVTYANAGHSLVLHIRADDGEMRFLQVPGMPLGVFNDAGMQQSLVRLAPGDALVLYTDGVVDVLNGAGVDFGQERLEAVLYGNRRKSAQKIVDAVLAALQQYAGSVPLFDDVTLIVVKRIA
jgi:serine phosphatase RsbU (regulator of sigma subunit)/putative methionine-R-sulfoxide reductase with GAF domain